MRARNRGRWGTRHLYVGVFITPLSASDWEFSNSIFKTPVICEQPQFTDYQEGLKKQQLVFEFDVKTWEVGHHFCTFDGSMLSVGTACLGSDQTIQHYRTHHSTKSESGQLEWEVVRVMRITTLYDVHDTAQIPRTLSMIYCFCLYLYTTNNHCTICSDLAWIDINTLRSFVINTVTTITSPWLKLESKHVQSKTKKYPKGGKGKKMSRLEGAFSAGNMDRENVALCTCHPHSAISPWRKRKL
jgi:hypothetical protein